MKKLVLCFITVLCAFSLCSCGSTTEINQRSIVHAVGIDKAEEGYEVSLQIFSPSGTGSDTPIDVSQSNTKVVAAKGKTIYEAVKACEYLLGGDIFMGHNKFIIFGSSLYNEDMTELLSWFAKENENYLGVTVGLAENDAKKVLDIKLTDGASAVENMQLIHEYAVKSGTTAEGDLVMLFNQLDESGGNGLLPVFSVSEKEKSDQGDGGGGEGDTKKEQYLEIKKTAVLKDKKVVGFVNHEEMAGVLWLVDRMEKNMVTLEHEGEKFDAELECKMVSAKLYIKDGKPLIRCSIRAEVRLVEEVSAEIKEAVCHLSEKKILSDCEAAVSKTVGELGADVLRIEKLTKFYEPSLFREYEDNFSEIVRSTGFVADVECRLAN